MPDEITPQANPIPSTGETEWFPPAEDDAVATPYQPQPTKSVRWVFMGREGLRAGWSLLIYIALFAALGIGLFTVMTKAGVIHRSAPGAHPAEQSAKVAVLTEGAQFAAAALAAFIMTFLERRRFSRYGLGSFAGRGLQFAGGALLGLASLSALVGVLWWRGLLLLRGTTMRGAPIVEWGFIWAISFLCVGLFEEYLTRGYLQFTLARGLAGIAGAFHASARTRNAVGFWLAALFFSFIFGLGHKSNPGESPIGLVAAGLIGLVFAFTLWRTGSLWFAVGWHAAWDWAESFLWSVPDSGLMVQHHLTNAVPQGPVLWSGGVTGPEGSWFVLPVIAITGVLFAILLKPQPGSAAYQFAHADGYPPLPHQA